MPTVASVLREKLSEGKPDEVFVTSPDATVLQAARLMNDKRIGSLAVVSSKGALDGIITERDVLMRVVATEKAPSTTKVSDVMTSPVIAVNTETHLDAVRTLMREKHIRHVPVVEDGQLIGMISIGDLNRVDARVLAEHIEHLEAYIYRPM